MASEKISSHHSPGSTAIAIRNAAASVSTDANAAAEPRAPSSDMGDPSVVVLGGGLAGVATAYALAQAGCRDVTIVERGPRLGGLAGSFERNGHFYPLGYHHILHRDATLLWFL